jgi:hypothetical protein
MNFLLVLMVGVEDLGQIITAVLKDQKYVGLSDLNRWLLGSLVIVLTTVLAVVVIFTRIVALTIVGLEPATHLTAVPCIPATDGNFQQIDNVWMARTDP